MPTGFTAPGAATYVPAAPPASTPPSAPPNVPPSAPPSGYGKPAPVTWGQPALGYTQRPSAGYDQPGFTFPTSPTAVPEPDTTKPREDRPSGTAFDVAVVTQLPLMIGGQMTLELPYRLLLQGELGVLPPAYVNALDSALVSTGTYDSTTSTLVRNGLKNSLVARLSAGWRPFPKHGFEMMAGYTLASMGGGVSAKQAVAAVAGLSIPDSVPDQEVTVRTTIHNVHVSLGWRWVIADHLVIRASLAYLQSVSSSSHVEVPAAIGAIPEVSARLPQVNEALDTRLNDTYTKYGKLPVLGVSMGYRF